MALGLPQSNVKVDVIRHDAVRIKPIPLRLAMVENDPARSVGKERRPKGWSSILDAKGHKV